MKEEMTELAKNHVYIGAIEKRSDSREDKIKL